MTNKLIIVVLLLICHTFVFGQKKYSIDVEKTKNRRVPLAYFVSQSVKEFKDAHEWRKNKRAEVRSSRRTRKHIYNIQDKKVKKRMRKSAKKADKYNKGKIPFSEKVKNIFNGRLD